MYSWMARWLQRQPADAHVSERPFTPERLSDLLLFEGRPLPDGALDAEHLTAEWIDLARRQMTKSNGPALQTALLHMLAQERHQPARELAKSRTVVMAGGNPALEAALTRAGFSVHAVRPTAYDAPAAAKVDHFDTYNRTAANQQVADIVRTVEEHPGAMLVAGGELGPAALLAIAIVPVSRTVVDIEQFDNSSDQLFVDHLYIPGLRRAGDFSTAFALASGTLIVHNAADRFKLDGARVLTNRLEPPEIVALLR